MYCHFLGEKTIETNFDLILSSPDDECFQIIILFLVFSISVQFTQKQERSHVAKKATEPYPDSQVIYCSRNFVHVAAAPGGGGGTSTSFVRGCVATGLEN